MHAPSLFPGPKPNHLISLCRKKLLAWKYVLRVHVQLSPGKPARFQYPPLHCLKWTQNSVMKWLVPTSFCKRMLALTKWFAQNTLFTKWHGWPETKSLQNASVCYKNAPGMEHGSSHFIVEMYTGIKTHHVRSTFCKLRRRKKCTPLWCAAHFQVKIYKHTMFGPLLEVVMWKKCRPLWRETHFQVKIYKTHWSWHVEKVHAVVTPTVRGTEHFWTFRCRFAWQARGIVHRVKSEQNVRVL